MQPQDSALFMECIKALAKCRYVCFGTLKLAPHFAKPYLPALQSQKLFTFLYLYPVLLKA